MTATAVHDNFTASRHFRRAVVLASAVACAATYFTAAMQPLQETSEAADTRLLERIADADAAALGELYDRCAGILFAVAVKILGDPAQAEDVLQEAFVSIWERAATYEARLGSPLGWAIVITRNKAIDRLRAGQRGRALLDRFAKEWLDEPLLHAHARPASADADTEGIVRAALAALPADQRQCIELAFFSGLSQSEIAAQLAQPLGTVKARIRRGMLRLRDDLEGKL